MERTADRNEHIKGMNAVLTIDPVEEVEEMVRKILLDAGDEGISVRKFFNHKDLERFTYSEIDRALARERNRAHVQLGAVATRFYWCGPR